MSEEVFIADFSTSNISMYLVQYKIGNKFILLPILYLFINNKDIL